jgi:hypothetical protein
VSTQGSALLVILFFLGLSAGSIGKIKGSSFGLWFAVGFFIPFIGVLAALMYRNERDELRRQCPGCGRVVKIYEALCTRCGTELEFPTEAIAPESVTRRSPGPTARRRGESSAPGTGA